MLCSYTHRECGQRWLGSCGGALTAHVSPSCARPRVARVPLVLQSTGFCDPGNAEYHASVIEAATRHLEGAGLDELLEVRVWGMMAQPEPRVCCEHGERLGPLRDCVSACCCGWLLWSVGGHVRYTQATEHQLIPSSCRCAVGAGA